MAVQFRTDLNCGSCVAKVAPYLDADPGIEKWSVDTENPAKVLTVAGPAANERHVADLVSRGGFHVLGPVVEEIAVEPRRSGWATYRPLSLIVLYLAGGATALAFRGGSFDWRLAMNMFMAGFFLVFSY